MTVQIQIRRGTASLWTSTNPTLAEGEIGEETDTRKAKIGDGTTAWNSLSYWIDPNGGGAIIETGTFSAPSTISGAISVPSDQRARVYLKGNASLVTVTSIGNGSGTQELYLYGCDDANRIKLSALSNLILSGEWQSGIDSQICLHWSASRAKWIEDHRNGV